MKGTQAKTKKHFLPGGGRGRGRGKGCLVGGSGWFDEFDEILIKTQKWKFL